MANTYRENDFKMVTYFNRLLVKKIKHPIFYKRLSRNHKKLWINIKTAIAFIYMENGKPSNISHIIRALFSYFDNEQFGYLIRCISTSKKIIDEIEKNFNTLAVKSCRYPINFGFECLLSFSYDNLLLNPLNDWWSSLDDFDLFIIQKDNLIKAVELFKINGKRNSNSIYYQIVNYSHLLMRKSGDLEEFELLSNIIEFDKVKIVLNQLKKDTNIILEIHNDL